MPSSCQDIRAALAECLQNSDCIMVQRHQAVDCLKSPLYDDLPTRCQQLKKGYGECRRGMVDMRKRFRGNQPMGVKVDTAVGQGQLYAGSAGTSQSGILSDSSKDKAQLVEGIDGEMRERR